MDLHYFRQKHPMKKSVEKLGNLLQQTAQFLQALSAAELTAEPAPGKWSKKQILGHLIDSAVNNLRRFTEIQFSSRPYPIQTYNQDELVKANDYQNADIQELIILWLSLNRRIQQVMLLQTEQTLSYPIILPGGENADLRFLMLDYVDHLEHHVRQIKNSTR